MTDGIQRRLAAILAADVVGYSRLMGEDEAGTLSGLRHLRTEHFAPAVHGHRGIIVKSMGDGWLVEFASVVDAVTCAIEVQEGLAEHESIKLRVGVHVGDITHEEEDIFGDGVNIAARLQEIAQPGGIVISDIARRSIDTKLAADFVDLGVQDLKNIAESIGVYGWGMTAITTEATVLQLPDKPSIAVPPFKNMSDDPEQEYFADGIAEDIITALSRFHWFFVISRNTSLTYRGVDAKRVAEELGVHYVLEGSVRRSGNRIRITTQLIDARVDHHVWAERYDRDLEDIFAVQDEITERIITSVAPGIVSAEMQRAHRKDIASLDAWERIMRAHWHLARFTMEDNAEARRLLTEAAQLEPNNALALGDLAMIHIFDGQWGWGISRDQSLAAAAEAARRAVTIDEANTWAHIALGFVELFAGRHSEAVRRLERAREISPNDPHAHGHLGFALSFSGEPQAAIARLEEAMRLSPRDPFLAIWYIAWALAAFSAERYEDAIEWANKTIEENPRYPGAYRVLAASFAQLDQIEQAKAALQQMLRQMPGMTVAATRQQVPWKKPNDAQRYLDGLRKAGLPE